MPQGWRLFLGSGVELPPGGQLAWPGALGIVDAGLAHLERSDVDSFLLSPLSPEQAALSPGSPAQ